MQRKSNLIEILGLLIGAASLALALAGDDSDIAQPVTSEGSAYHYGDRHGYAQPPAPPRHRYRDYYEAESCDPYYCDCACY